MGGYPGPLTLVVVPNVGGSPCKGSGVNLATLQNDATQAEAGRPPRGARENHTKNILALGRHAPTFCTLGVQNRPKSSMHWSNANLSGVGFFGLFYVSLELEPVQRVYNAVQLVTTVVAMTAVAAAATGP